MSKFYESFLACTYLESHADKDARERLLFQICASYRLKSPLLCQSNDVSMDPEKAWKAASERLMSLVLEESRHAIAEALDRRWNKSRFQPGLDLSVEFRQTRNGKFYERLGVFDFTYIRISEYFSARNKLDLLRPGSVVELHPIPSGRDRTRMEDILLGTFQSKVWTKKADRVVLEEEKGSIKLYVTDSSCPLPKHGRYRLYPLTSLLSFERQFKAVLHVPIKLYPDLMCSCNADEPIAAATVQPMPIEVQASISNANVSEGNGSSAMLTAKETVDAGDEIASLDNGKDKQVSRATRSSRTGEDTCKEPKSPGLIAASRAAKEGYKWEDEVASNDIGEETESVGVTTRSRAAKQGQRVVKKAVSTGNNKIGSGVMTRSRAAREGPELVNQDRCIATGKETNFSGVVARPRAANEEKRLGEACVSKKRAKVASGQSEMQKGDEGSKRAKVARAHRSTVGETQNVSEEAAPSGLATLSEPNNEHLSSAKECGLASKNVCQNESVNVVQAEEYAPSLAMVSSKPRSRTVDEVNSFVIPPMNKCQEAASLEFLDPNSSPGHITVVQGPPGTGKTTMLTATICNFLLQRRSDGNPHPRLMVCAPSNKAVTVLAARYLQAANSKSTFKMAMIGDKEKMLSEDHTGRFGNVFVYTWLQTKLKALEDIASASSLSALERKSTIGVLSESLFAVLHKSALHERPDGVKSLLQSIITSSVNGDPKQLQEAMKKLTNELASMERSIQDALLNNANVIFCTLSSAGASIILRTNDVEALIIDEAAAACEPESYIPIAAKRPKFILLVGDPKQLPATIMSPIAKSRNLGRSLQERLMYQVKRPYTMLKIQYRMKPEISRFPSLQFYEDKTEDGNNVKCTSYETPPYRTLVKDKAFCFLQVDGTEDRQPSGSFHNLKEAQQVTAILMEARRRNFHARASTPPNEKPWNDVDRIRVITFYQAQVDLILATLRANDLHGVSVSTVDSCQGSESELIVISFVRTGYMGIGFLSDDRRLNVALTRAKHKLICLGNIQRGLALIAGGRRDTETMRAFVQNVTDRKVLASRNSIPIVRVTNTHSVWTPSYHHQPNHRHQHQPPVWANHRGAPQRALNTKRRASNGSNPHNERNGKHHHR